MTDLVARPDLYPPNDDAPAITAIVAVDGRLDDVDTGSITTTKLTDIAPAGFLPFLAWEASADVWDDEWSEATKRAVIEAAPVVHRHKGTRYAVQTALGALGVKADVVEWWQTTPRKSPYTFSVTAVTSGRLYGGVVLDARLIRAVYAAIMAAKPTSRAFSLDVAAGTTGALGLAPVAVARCRATVAVRSRCSEFFAARLGMAPVAVARLRVAVSMIASAA